MKRLFDRFELNVTPLVAYGGVVLLLILGLLGLDFFYGVSDAQKSRLTVKKSELSVLEAVKNTDIWPARLEKSLELKKRVEGTVWHGNTTGVIAAELQQVIRSISKEHKVDNIVVNVDAEANQIGEVQILRFDLTGRIPSGKDTIGFFEDLSSYKHNIIMDELSVTNSIRDKRPTYMTLSGLIPITLNSAQPGSGG